jgi:restriction enzyme bgcI subunit beta
MSRLSLENIIWKEFKLNTLFEFKLSKGDNQASLLEEGDIPLISSGLNTNGITKFIKNGDGKAEKFGEKTITIDMFGKAFYHDYSYFSVSHGRVNILIPKFTINKYIAVFLITVIDNCFSNIFSYNRMCSQNRLNSTKILLPTTHEGTPNWRFMEEYTKKEMKKQSQTVSNYFKNKLMSLSCQQTQSEVEWKEFWMEELVDISPGVRLTKMDQIDGDIPFIGATDSNNGITEFVGNINKSIDNNVLGVNYNGSVVENFYHVYECIFSDDVKRIKFKNKKYGDEFTYLFLKQLILSQKSKYQYGYKFNTKRMNRQKIMLPIDENGDPNWKYMSNFIKNLEKENIERIIEYLNLYNQ